jgi:hypothetical protein
LFLIEGCIGIIIRIIFAVWALRVGQHMVVWIGNGSFALIPVNSGRPGDIAIISNEALILRDTKEMVKVPNAGRHMVQDCKKPINQKWIEANKKNFFEAKTKKRDLNGGKGGRGNGGRGRGGQGQDGFKWARPKTGEGEQ